MPKQDRPFPIETARDMLGICRAMYLVWQERGLGKSQQLRQLRDIGRELRRAIELAQRSAPGSKEHRLAWEWGESAVASLSALIDSYEMVRPAVKVLSKRISPWKWDRGVTRR